MTRVVFVVSESGCERRRCVAPLETLDAAGVELTVATPTGERPSFDAADGVPGTVTDTDGSGRRSRAPDPRIAEPVALGDVGVGDYDAVVFTGGYGAVLDVNRDRTAAALLRETVAADDGVALVAGHAVGLLSGADLDGASADRRQFTGFSSAGDAPTPTPGEPQAGEGGPTAAAARDRPAGESIDSSADPGTTVRADGSLITARGPASLTGAVRALLTQLGLSIPS